MYISSIIIIIKNPYKKGVHLAQKNTVWCVLISHTKKIFYNEVPPCIQNMSPILNDLAPRPQSISYNICGTMLLCYFVVCCNSYAKNFDVFFRRPVYLGMVALVPPSQWAMIPNLRISWCFVFKSKKNTAKNLQK